MATLVVDEGDLVLALARWERFAACRGDVRVPLASVEDATVGSKPYRELRGWRAPGTAVPGIGVYTTLRHRGAKDFVAVRPRRRAVVGGSVPGRRRWRGQQLHR